MTRTLCVTAAAAFLAAGAVMIQAPAASAGVIAPLAAPAVPSVTQASDVVLIQQRRQRMERRWDRNRHGPRYRNRHGPYRHYHGGYWYRTPWWALTIPFAAGAAMVGSSNAHIAWCSERYRSYNVSRDAFRGYDGLWHRCNSPYR